MPNAEARRKTPGPLEVVAIERSFLREVGSVFWFIVNTFQESVERVQQGRAPFRAASFFRESVRAGVDSVPLVGENRVLAHYGLFSFSEALITSTLGVMAVS